MKKFILGIVIATFFFASTTNANNENPDVLITFGCMQEQTALDLAHVWVEKGEYYFEETAIEYLQTEECFILYEPGYPAYIDKVVKKLDKQYLGMPSYVVQAHFYGSPHVNEEDYKSFFFLYHGDLPERAMRRETL